MSFKQPCVAPCSKCFNYCINYFFVVVALIELVQHRRYKGPSRQKLVDPVLGAMCDKCLLKQRKFLEQRTGYGRCLTGDGATIQGTKYINFLVHEYSKGSMLCGMNDCSGRLSDVGAVQATYIAHNMMGACRSVQFFFDPTI